MDLSVAVGKRFAPASTENSSAYAWTPLLGYSLHQQRLTMTDGDQTIPASGPYPGLDSVYTARWQGPWLGLAGQMQLDNEWSLATRLQFHILEYRAQGNWNLRTDFAHPLSFEHRAKGQGIVLNLHATYALPALWLANIDLDYTSMRTRPGTDRTYFADGSVADYPLNEVAWESAAITFSIGKRY